MSDSKDKSPELQVAVDPSLAADPTEDDPGLATGADAPEPFVPRGERTRPASKTNLDLTESIPPNEQATHGDPEPGTDDSNIAGYVPPIYDPDYEAVTR